MGHAGNWSPRKVALERQRAAERELAEQFDPLVAPGWRRDRQGIWWPVLTPTAMLLRGVLALGSCTTPECRRRVRVDLAWWCEHGHGDEDVRDLLPSYRCTRTKCGLWFGDEAYPNGRPTIDYTAIATNAIHQRCTVCPEWIVWKPEPFAAQLRMLRIGDGNTPVVQAARAMEGQPCPGCAECAWSIRAHELSWSPATDGATRQKESIRARSAARMLSWPREAKVR